MAAGEATVTTSGPRPAPLARVVLSRSPTCATDQFEPRVKVHPLETPFSRNPGVLHRHGFTQIVGRILPSGTSRGGVMGAPEDQHRGRSKRAVPALRRRVQEAACAGRENFRISTSYRPSLWAVRCPSFMR